MTGSGKGPEPDPGLTHIDDHGRARMVDVTGKAVTQRHAVARCVVRASAAALEGLAGHPDDPVACARVAGIQAAKRTAELVPLCHPLPLDDIQVGLALGDGGVVIEATATVHQRTGVEMEALTACATAGLSVVMALLPADPTARIDDLTLWHKSGGRSGTWRRDEAGRLVAPGNGG